jgi:hypothetical protein
VFCHRRGKLELATVVDHIRRHRGDMNLFWDSSNWQPLCKRCHDGEKQRIDKRMDKTGENLPAPVVPVTIYAGPPASGKSTTIKDIDRSKHMVIDFAEIVARLAGRAEHHGINDNYLRQAGKIRQDMYHHVHDADIPYESVHILGGFSKYSQRMMMKRRFNATVVVYEIGAAECLWRVQRSPDRMVLGAKYWQPIIEDWWRNYSSGPGDDRVIRD